MKYKKTLFHTKLGLTKIENTGGIYSGEKPFDYSGIDKTHLECDFVGDSVVYGIICPFLNSLAVNEPPIQKITEKPRTILYKKINVLNEITFYVEDEKNNKVNFKGETLTFTTFSLKN